MGQIAVWSRRALGCLVGALLAVPLMAAAAQAAPAVAVSPLNGTPDASPYTQISFLGVAAAEITKVSVVGSSTGSHSGSLKSYVSATGASFLPTHQFAQGESVTASATVGPKGHTSTVKTTFTVARLAPYSEPQSSQPHLTRPGLVQKFHSSPSLEPPSIFVTADSDSAAQGDIFLTPSSGYGQRGAMIMDRHGRLIWFHPAPKGQTAADLQVESYQGQPVLVWWQGHVATGLGVGFGRVAVYSTSYKPVATIGAGNGYQADLHEAQLTPSGSAYITAYTLVNADLSSAGGKSDGILQDAIVQQVDVPTGLVMFEWHAYGHVALYDSYSNAPKFIQHPWDFFHVNSVSLDPWGDGNFMVSSRNTWAAYEVNHVSGSVMYRLGGRHPTFKMGPGTGTAYQHDVRWQPDHTLTIFDNGAAPKRHSESRAIRERIDFAKRTVSLVGRLTGKILSGSQGDDQILANGDSFIGWGEEPYLTEFSPTGQVLFSAHFPSPGQSYRALRFPWSAVPASRPAIAVSAPSATSATVYASWNGATGVTAWRVLGGPSSSSLSPLATVNSTGFETAIPVGGAVAFMSVQALGASGEVLGSSPAQAR